MNKAVYFEQKRAKKAYEIVVNEWNKSKARDKIRSKIRSAPSMIQSNGLGQSLMFWVSKGFSNRDPKKSDGDYWVSKAIFDYLKETKEYDLSACKDPIDLVNYLMSDSISAAQYRRITKDVMAFLSWLKRYTEAILPEE